jgi:hypothetical protein
MDAFYAAKTNRNNVTEDLLLNTSINVGEISLM